MHNFRIKTEGDDLRVLELFVEAKGVREARSLRILRDHVYEPSMLFTSLKNAFIVFAKFGVRRMPCHSRSIPI